MTGGWGWGGVSYRAFAHQFILTAACTAHMGSSLLLSGGIMTPGRSHSYSTLFGSMLGGMRLTAAQFVSW